jgi:hypothetical protein
MVRVDSAGFDAGVMPAGENRQCQPAGSAPQESDTRLLNGPDCGIAVTVKLADIPADIFSVEGDALKVNVGGVTAPQAGLYVMGPAIWLARLGLPTACTKSV